MSVRHSCPLDQADERVVEVLSSGLPRELLGTELRNDMALAQQDELIAVRPSSSTWLETSKAAPSDARSRNRAQTSRRNRGSSPTVGSSNSNSRGLPTSAAASDTRALSAGEVAYKLMGQGVSCTRSSSDPIGRPRTADEVTQVLGHRHVFADRGGLSHVAKHSPGGHAPRLFAQDGNGPADLVKAD